MKKASKVNVVQGPGAVKDDIYSIPGVERTGEEILLIDHKLIRRFKKQPRKEFDEGEIRGLAESFKKIGQILPTPVRRILDDPEHPFELVDGERRLRACKLADCPVRAFVIRSVKDWETQYMASVAANFGRSEHTPMEIAMSINELRQMGRFKSLGATEQIKEIAKIFVKTEVWVYQYLSLLRLDHSVKIMLSPALRKSERINLTIAFRLAQCPVEIQKTLAEKAVAEKLTVDQVNFFARKMADEAGIEVLSGKHARRPSDDLSMVQSFISRNKKALDIFLDPLILNQLRRGVPTSLMTMAMELGVCADMIRKLADGIIAPEDVPVPAKVVPLAKKSLAPPLAKKESPGKRQSSAPPPVKKTVKKKKSASGTNLYWDLK